LYGLALRWCDSAEDAQDAIQNMWVRACSALLTFQWKSSLKTWLTGVLINCLRELSRQRQPESVELSDEHPGQSNVGPEKLTLEKAIASLPLGYRQVLTLHDVEGYTHEEISLMLDVTVGTSKSQLHHARKAFRSAFLNGANHDKRT